ncbi:MAG: hypothetical protein ACK4VI_06550 [Alphaproteobacteria bacterium]
MKSSKQKRNTPYKQKIINGKLFLELTTHEFKSNIGRFARMCESGEIAGVLVKRFDVVVGIYMSYEGK